MQRYRAVKFRVCDKDLIRLTVFHPWSRWRLLDTNKQTNKQTGGGGIIHIFNKTCKCLVRNELKNIIWI